MKRSGGITERVRTLNHIIDETLEKKNIFVEPIWLTKDTKSGREITSGHDYSFELFHYPGWFARNLLRQEETYVAIVLSKKGPIFDESHFYNVQIKVKEEKYRDALEEFAQLYKSTTGQHAKLIPKKLRRE